MASDNNTNSFSSNGNSNTTGHYRGEHIPDIDLVNNNDEVNFLRIYGILLRNKWFIFIIIGIFLIASVGISFILTPIYQSDGTIIISEAPNRYSMAGNDLSNLLMSSYGIGVGSSVANELEVLNSRTMAHALADKLMDEKYDEYGNLYPLLWRDYPKDSTIIGIDSVARRIMYKKSIKQKGTGLSSILTIRFESSSNFEAYRMVNLIIDTYSEASTSTNRVQARAALNFLRTELQNVKNDVDDKEELLRQFMNQSQLVQLDAQTNELVRSLSRLESEKQAIEVNLVAAKEAIKRYTEELENIKPGLAEQYLSSIAPVLQRLQIQLAELETERILMISKNPELRNSPEESPRLKDLNEQIQIIQDEIRKSTNQVINTNVEQLFGFIVSPSGGIPSKLAEIREELLSLEIKRTQYEAQTRLLNIQITEYNNFFEDLPDNMIELARLKRDLLVNEQLYITLAKQSSEMALWEQTQSGLARIVDRAHLPTSPIKPKKKIIVLIGLFFGASLSIGIVFLKDWSKKEIDSIDKLRKKGLPILSVIPDLNPYIEEHFDGKEHVSIANQDVSTGLVTLLDALSPSAEAYRRLQSNISYSKPDNPYKVLLVTSSNKSEGKTTLTSNLAIILAETGKRVLIIDCDFRRPRIHNVFGFSKKPGLVDLLFENKEPKEYINQSLVDNVFVLTSGIEPPNPAEINRSQKMRDLISRLKYEYDYVILDTPPYGIIADAAPLIKQSDGVILTVKFNQTTHGELDHTIDSLIRINANLIGSCMTAFDSKKTSGYYTTDYYYQASYTSYEEYDKRES